MKHNKSIERIRTPYVWLNPRKCKACWACLDACPSKVIGKVSFLWHRHALTVNSGACTGCLKCVKTCSAGAFNKISKT
ncbi:MAG: ferredoxin family protein [Prevotellaceae bacterium]|nr:ferredoxin family protein [Prevotellaceae bacterium]